MNRLTLAWRAMHSEQRLAGLSALGLLLTMFLPWYSLQSVNRKTGVIYSHSISAFGDVSFVEAAIFLVAAGVLVMLIARAERREFHLPGGDGTVVLAAGCWAALLIFYRVFSRPAGDGNPVGIEWGFFLAFVAAGALAYAGWRLRSGERPPPPARASSRRRAHPQPPAPAPGVGAASRAPYAANPSGRGERPRYPPAPGEQRRPRPDGDATVPGEGASPGQLSFEDPPTRAE